MQAAEVDATLAVLDGGQDSLYTAGLLVGDAAAADRVSYLFGGRVRDLLPGRVSPLELGEGTLGVHVRRVLRQHSRHDLVNDRQHRLGDERVLVGPQPALDRRGVGVNHRQSLGDVAPGSRPPPHALPLVPRQRRQLENTFLAGKLMVLSS
jgi:hypothetical protein